MIKLNQKVPDGQLQQRVNGETITHNTSELFANKKTVLFAVPGAFTPTCSAAHLPGYVDLAEQIKARGVAQIICLSVNDAFVMDAWGQAHHANEIMMLADGDGSYANALGLSKDTGAFGGVRLTRFAAIIDDGIVEHLVIEPPKTFEQSSAERILEKL